MNLTDICIRRPVFTTMLMAFLLVIGTYSYFLLGVDLFPNVDLPIVTVTTTLKGASAEEMETGVTRPLEEAINTINGIDELRSVTREGSSQIFVQFVLEKNGDVAAQDVRDKVAVALARLPEGTEPPVIDKLNIEATPVLTIAVSGNRNIREVTEIAKKMIKEDLETLPGVGSITIAGGRDRAIRVTVDADRLAAYGLSIQQVKRALQTENAEIPGGRVDQGKRELVLRTMGRIDRVEEFQDLIVANKNGRSVTLGDIGTVRDGMEESRTLARLNGENAVALIVQKQSGENAVQLIDRLKTRLAELRTTLPRDIEAEIMRDLSRFIKPSIELMQVHLVMAALLVVLVVWIFLGNWRSMLIGFLAIPISIIGSFGFMRLMDFTLDNLTMLGLVLAVGIVIDDAVVILENIFRHVEEKGLNPMAAASSATREISLAVMATTLSLLVIFLPMAFMGGIVGRFFYSFGITVAFSLAISLLVSFTLTPMLASRLLKTAGTGRSKETLVYRGVERFYSATLAWSLRHRWVIVLAGLGCLLLTVPLFQIIGKDFFPPDDQSEFEITVQAPEGTSLEGMDGTMSQLEARTRKLGGVKNLLTTIGDTTGRVGKGEGDVTGAKIYVQMVDLHERDFSQFDVMEEARRFLVDYPDLRTSVQGSGRWSSGGTRSPDVEFNIRGPDLAVLASTANRIVEKIDPIPGFVDLDTTLSVRKPELQATIDRKKASDFGVPIQEVASTLRALVGGEAVSTYQEEGEQYDVWLRAEPADRDDPESLYNLTVPSERAGLVRLGNLLTFEEERGPSQIDRLGRQRKVTVIANLADLPIGTAMEEIRKAGSGIELPLSYQTDFSGRAQTFREMGVNFAIAFGLSVIFMYMILAAQFESFLHPLAIMLALPVTVPFALISLLLIGDTLNLYSILGLFMLLGIVKKNGILQIDYTNTLRTQGIGREPAILEANRTRLRPILMTTLMLVAGMIPIALGTGPGAATRASMAKVIIGGQALSLLLSLLVTPIAYSLFDDFLIKAKALAAKVGHRGRHAVKQR